MELVSAVVTLLNLVLASVVGVRLLGRGRREGRPPETALGVYFLAGGALGTLLSCAAYGAVAQRALGPADAATRGLVLSSHLFYVAGTAGVYHFTAQVFRPGSVWARRACVAAIAAFVLGLLLEIPGDAFAVVILPGFGYWLAFVARTGGFAWAAFESLRYWNGARRRVRLGFTEPLVCNRFLLWGLWSVTLFVSAWTEPAARVAYVLSAGTRTELVLEVMRPIVLGVIGLTSLLSSVSLVTLALTFFPTPAYRRWVEARAARRTV